MFPYQLYQPICFPILLILQINYFYHKFLQAYQFQMGSTIERVQAIDLTDYAPPLQQYKLAHSGPNYFVWDHCLQDGSLIQFPINILNDQVLKQYIDTYLFRHRHHLLVSTLYFRRNQETGKGSIFYERVFTNLARIKDIPFADSLQFYYVAFKGFQLLYKKFGFFQVEEEMLHITKNKKIKIWCHRDISKQKPKQIAQSMRGGEADMVRRIIQIIQQNLDHSGTNYPVGPEIYEKASTNFSVAIQRLRQICFRQKFIIPDKLTCLDLISQGDVGVLLDQYGPNIGQHHVQAEPQTIAHTKPLTNLDLFAIRPENSNNKPQLMIPIQTFVGQNQLANTKNTRKGRGLQVSHSFENLKQNNRNCLSHMKINQKNQINYPIYSPQYIVNSPIKQLEDQTLNSVKINNVAYQIPQQQFYHQPQPLNLHPQPSISRQPSSPQLFHPPQFIQGRPLCPITRSNSFDNINQSQPSKNKTQYRIVINGMDRPVSSVSPKESIQLERPPLNNFLNPRLLTVLPPGSHPPSQFTKSNNINPTSPQLIQKQSSNNQLHRFFSQNINSLNIQSKNESCEMPAMTPQLKCRQTFISDFSSFESEHRFQPLKDQTNFKSRFEEYKKNFNFNKYSSKENKDSKPDFKKQNKLEKPFFGGILNSETVNSYLESNGCGQKHSEAEKFSEKSIKNETNQFPSITDVSDNISSFPNKEKLVEDRPWREQSVVIKHDPNERKMQMPGPKKYEPKIDEEIWADMVKARNKMKLGKSDI